ncbi:GMC oxidoreductase [Marinoscillum furvescens]|uniref:Choline dehydrogenase-like flavoprotein n=1 Tax=Marinoscillum furvescens DSM 4134 TaxID=1122208 RepID=A0A3D9KZ50_MARFU|nr:GMC family oxidoreductase [Marinoscillum furvescens]RED93379.1 choline dehydrogenase-like flavoprotein [Marinoscillum furvescens DSM 4134]
MSYIITGKAKAGNTYDAIVIGSGISGGWAAKEFCEKGLKTLVLERGRNVEHVKDYPTAMKEQWEFPHRMEIPPQIRNQNPILDKCYAWNESTDHFFVKDEEHPYIQKKPFHWIKGYQVGGKSLMWARMTQRWSDLDFEANAKDGYGVDWPIRYKDIAPWYSYVEKFVGVTGNKDGIPHLPDGEFLPPFEMNCLEKHVKATIEERFEERHLIIGRRANHTERVGNRGPCMKRDRCYRGCPLGGYFSSNSATIPAAIATGNLTLRPDSVVHSIIYDEESGKATGVRVIDTHTKEMMEYYSKVVFVNASTINSTLILMNSTSSRFPNGLGNDSGQLGKNLMDHNYEGAVSGQHDGFKDGYYDGKRPVATYIPRFRNVGNDKRTDYVRGFSFSFEALRSPGNMEGIDAPFGADFKNGLFRLGSWHGGMGGMGEMLPYEENQMTLSKEETDQWGMPLVEFNCDFKDNEYKMLDDIVNSGAEMLEAAGFKNIKTRIRKKGIGLGIHEMGTARMGRDPKTSVLNGNNQLHAVKNVFVTDGSCMTSGACQNPSITYMALTARAVDFAVSELKKRNL